ncbi:MAG: TRAP transporter large permease subunit, partial [Dehalococcoidales bacterium]|nr:TRAP transporter large permease subunit [Dehalococcoidales bacterium]
MKLESSKIRILFVQAVTMVLFVFQLYTAGLGSLPGTQQLSLHFGLVMIVLFLTIGWHGKRKSNDPLKVWDFIFVALVLFCAGIAFLAWRRWMMFPSRMSTTDLIGAAIVTVLILEGSRRLLGWALHIVLAVLLVYVLVGPLLPGRFGTASFGWIPTLRSLGVEGAWGWITSISARTIAVYMLFGGMLAAFGGARPFIDVANVIAGRFRGGPALVAVVGSGLFG